MGSCLCKEKSPPSAGGASVNSHTSQVISIVSESSISCSKRHKMVEMELIEQLILKTLHYISTYHGCGDVTPAALTKLNQIADSEEGWCKVVMALIHAVPLHDPLGLSAITLVFEDCPLPTRETVVEFTKSLNVTSARCVEAYTDYDSIRQERNLLAILGCIAEKFAGPHAVEILTTEVLVYLVTFLVHMRQPHLILHALIALEKFGLTAENKATINSYYREQLLHPLLPLEMHHDSDEGLWKQIGFCAKWTLDNTSVSPGRPFSFECINMDTIQVILNTSDGSEYIKISPDGLEARSDSHSFESVRGTFEITDECWYYEVQIVTDGVMQIGWASKITNFRNHDGYGVGDDAFSLAYDGCRRLLWYKAQAKPHFIMPSWQVGDILGCLIDVTHQEAIFSLNGTRLPVFRDIFRIYSEGFCPAASFMAHQQCRFNFGATPFMFPPKDRRYRIMNDFGMLTNEEKQVIPRRVLMERLQVEERVTEQRCVVCLNAVGDYGVKPCAHGEFCLTCVKLLRTCPVCRGDVKSFYILML